MALSAPVFLSRPLWQKLCRTVLGSWSALASRVSGTTGIMHSYNQKTYVDYPRPRLSLYLLRSGMRSDKNFSATAGVVCGMT